jgi:hypothetical protein
MPADFLPPSVPDWTRVCKGSDLAEIRGFPYILRESEDSESPWRSVAGTHDRMSSDPELGVRVEYMTVDFYSGGQREISAADDVEVGLLRPPWWPDDVEPPEWPRPKGTGA